MSRRSLDVYYGDPAHEARMVELYGSFVKPGALAFDIGSHVGDRIGAFRRLGARVVALEPQPLCMRARGDFGNDPAIGTMRIVLRSDTLRKDLVAYVRKEIGPIASPDLIQFAPGLPKTRSGKIMRRILRKIAENDFSNLGDTTTLADPSVVDDLVANRRNK